MVIISSCCCSLSVRASSLSIPYPLNYTYLLIPCHYSPWRALAAPLLRIALYRIKYSNQIINWKQTHNLWLGRSQETGFEPRTSGFLARRSTTWAILVLMPAHVQISLLRRMPLQPGGAVMTLSVIILTTSELTSSQEGDLNMSWHENQDSSSGRAPG